MDEEKISLEHGAGGKSMMNLIEGVILKELEAEDNLTVGLDDLDDGASMKVGDKNLVISTDSHSIKPLFFPGGDIGRLAVAGTVNDVAVMGGKPIAMAVAVVLREGFPTEKLRQIMRSMKKAADEAGVSVATGDTKVVGKEALDGMIVTTTGVGLADSLKTDSGLKPGDRIIVTGNIAEHEAAIIAQREEIDIGTPVESDVAPIWDTIKTALERGGVTAMKDPTRGGLAGALNELASKSGVGIALNEKSIPVSEPVRNICELLGIDSLNLTNEGRAVIGVEKEKARSLLESIRDTKHGKNAEIIGEVTEENPGKVTLITSVGGHRVVRAAVGAPTPRIC